MRMSLRDTTAHTVDRRCSKPAQMSMGKRFRTAVAAECEPIELCDKHVKMFQDLNKMLRVENDVYNRTTSEKHKQCCRELFERSEKNGDIYLDTYSGGTMFAKKRL